MIPDTTADGEGGWADVQHTDPFFSLPTPNRADGEALAEAIAELRRAKAEDSATIDTHDALDLVLNAVLSGQLIPRPAANGWRPIETAPRDGTWFRARTEHGTERVVHFADEADRYPINHDREVWSTAPVEWTPAAPRPAEPAQAAQADWEALAAAGEALADGAQGMVTLLDKMMREPGRDLSGSEADTVDRIANAIPRFRAALIAATQEGRE